MKKRITIKMVLVVGAVWVVFSLEADYDKVTFDRLLPDSSYAHVYALCMRSWHGMRCCEGLPIDHRAMGDLNDCLLGRLVRMKATIKKLPVNPPHEYTGYLLLLLRSIEVEQKEYLQHNPLAHGVLRKSQYHLLHLLQKVTQVQ